MSPRAPRGAATLRSPEKSPKRAREVQNLRKRAPQVRVLRLRQNPNRPPELITILSAVVSAGELHPTLRVARVPSLHVHARLPDRCVVRREVPPRTN